jgi:hypothetical protein
MEQVSLSLITYLGIPIFMGYISTQPGIKRDLGTAQMCVVSLTLHLIYLCVKYPEYQLKRRLYGPQIWPGSLVEVENLLILPGT